MRERTVVRTYECTRVMNASTQVHTLVRTRVPGYDGAYTWAYAYGSMVALVRRYTRTTGMSLHRGSAYQTRRLPAMVFRGSIHVAAESTSCRVVWRSPQRFKLAISIGRGFSVHLGLKVMAP